MLHAHVETLLNHRVFLVPVRPRPHAHCRPRLSHVRLKALLLKPLLLGVESQVVLHRFASGLLESAGSAEPVSTQLALGLGRRSNFRGFSMDVLPGARNVELQALPIENLVVVEARRGLVEANILSGEHFVVRSSPLGEPLLSGVLEVVLNLLARFDDVFRVLEEGVLDLASVVGVCSILLRLEDAHGGVGFLEVVKSVGGGQEDAVRLGPLLLSSGERASGGV